jgi:Protein of unknown function (DUF4058)
MPLRDHFHAPLFPRRSWESLHTHWTTCIGARLNEILPPRFYAQVQAHLGDRVEADVAEFERTDEREWDEPAGNGAGGGVAVQTWAPPVATLTMPAVFPDAFEIHIRDERRDARLVAVVELVSPGNKDRPDTRLAFASKSAAYLQRGIGLVIIDTVTDRRFNLHNELVTLLNLDPQFEMPHDPPIYAIGYRPTRRGDADLIDAWPSVLSVGAELPIVPLWLRGFRSIPLELELTYEEACRRDRV